MSRNSIAYGADHGTAIFTQPNFWPSVHPQRARRRLCSLQRYRSACDAPVMWMKYVRSVGCPINCSKTCGDSQGIDVDGENFGRLRPYSAIDTKSSAPQMTAQIAIVTMLSSGCNTSRRCGSGKSAKQARIVTRWDFDITTILAKRKLTHSRFTSNRSCHILLYHPSRRNRPDSMNDLILQARKGVNWSLSLIKYVNPFRDKVRKRRRKWSYFTSFQHEPCRFACLVEH